MIYDKVKNNKIIKAICSFQSSDVYIYVLCAIAVLSNAFALDGFAIALILISLCITNLFCDSLMPALPAIFNVAFCISPKNSPAHGDYGYYTSTTFLCVIGFLVLAVLVTAAVRFFINKNYKKISFSRGLASGMVVYAAALLLNGTFAPGHDILDFASGALTVFTFTAIYFFFVAALSEDLNYDYLCKSLVASGFTVLLQLGVFYVKNLKNMSDIGNDWKNAIYLGWGISNTAGQYVAMMILPCFYFAVKKGRVLTSFVLAGALFSGAFFSLCRSGMLFGAVACVAGVIAACVFSPKKKKSIICSLIFGAIAISVFLLAYFNVLFPDLFGFLHNMGFSDRGRYDLWEKSIRLFYENPLFGAGFNGFSRQYGNAFVLGFAHNTVIQMFASCGVAGVIAYMYQRAQLVKLCVHKPHPVRALIIGTVCMCLLLGLLDITAFSPYFNIVHAVLVAFMERESMSDEKFSSVFTAKN